MTASTQARSREVADPWHEPSGFGTEEDVRQVLKCLRTLMRVQRQTLDGLLRVNRLTGQTDRQQLRAARAACVREEETTVRLRVLLMDVGDAMATPTPVRAFELPEPPAEPPGAQNAPGAAAARHLIAVRAWHREQAMTWRLRASAAGRRVAAVLDDRGDEHLAVRLRSELALERDEAGAGPPQRML